MREEEQFEEKTIFVKWLTLTHLNRFLRKMMVHTALDLHMAFHRMFVQVRVAMIHSPEWLQEFNIGCMKVERKYEDFIREIEIGGEAMSENYLAEIKDELLKLPLLPDFSTDSSEPLNDLVQTIKDDVKKGNRVTFKLIQELQERFDQLSNETIESQREQMKDAVRLSEQRYRKLLALMLEVFDLLDLVRTSSIQMGDSKWSQELEKVVEKALLLLKDYGIEEIRVDGQMFDGHVMEGIGTVSEQEINRDLGKYKVYSVYSRGFRLKENGEIIRKAKVITVY